MPFTPEELEEMEKADQEIEESFVLTNEEIAMAREYDKRAKYEAMTGDKQKVAAYQKAWYEANREKVAAQQEAYREANPKGKEVKPMERETVRQSGAWNKRWTGRCLISERRQTMTSAA